MKRKAVTLVEVVIALFVFAVGILAVVRVITTNISVIDTMKLKMQAQSLAKEWIDMIFNIRDTNLVRGVDWHCAYISPEATMSLQDRRPFKGEICGEIFEAGKSFDVSLDIDGKITSVLSQSWTDFATLFAMHELQTTEISLPVYSGTLLTNDGTTGSYFARYISFDPVYQSGVQIDTNKLLKVTSHVLYRKGSIQWETTIESLIGAIK